MPQDIVHSESFRGKETVGMFQTASPIKDNPFRGQHILSVDQFSRESLEECILPEAQRMRQRVALDGRTDKCKGCILGSVFFEPSTRTSASFTSAMERLGGSVIPINEVKYSSIAKGEDLEDMGLTMECYADVLVIRHPETGSVAKLASVCKRRPVINAGDGIGEHPTQALLDLFTIQQELCAVEDAKVHSIDGLVVTMLGDLKHGRTVHSLSKLLALYRDITLHLVSPPNLRMPLEMVTALRERGIQAREHDSLEEVISQTNVLYVTRIQKERFTDPDEYQQVQGSYIITPKTMESARPPKEMIVMHPLPRVGEISKKVDADPRAAYIRQMEYGLFMRMALVALVLGRV
jgi:aspartate carbamoyltransferase